MVIAPRVRCKPQAACDIIIARDDARFAATRTRFGLTPLRGCLQRVPRKNWRRASARAGGHMPDGRRF
jgi:enoyl-CoA hydratase/carnithine racemase